jgi:hypothetical protein
MLRVTFPTEQPGLVVWSAVEALVGCVTAVEVAGETHQALVVATSLVSPVRFGVELEVL